MAKNKYSRVDLHDFYCINCGNRGMPILRNAGHQHNSLHRKKLYCLTCKTEINHVECRSAYDVEVFKSNYEKGAYKNEAEASLHHVGATSKGQNQTMKRK